MVNNGFTEVISEFKKTKIFYKLSYRLFFNTVILYLKFYVYKILMKTARTFHLERWVFQDFKGVYSNAFRVPMELSSFGIKIAQNLEKRLVLKIYNQNGFVDYYLFLDLFNFKKTNKFYNLFLFEVINFYKIIKIVFCNYFADFFVKVGYSAEEQQSSEYTIYFQEMFVDALFQYYPVDFFFTILDYYLWRVTHVGHSFLLSFLNFLKNSSFDLVYYSRFVSVLSVFRKFYNVVYIKKGVFDFKIVVFLFIYRDYILKIVMSSLKLSVFFFFLFQDYLLLVYSLRNRFLLKHFLVNNLCGFLPKIKKIK
jgi:hypothetical protein